MRFRSILLVCTGNICRSPIAEGLFYRRLTGTSMKISSAGISALVGRPADPKAIEVARRAGVDIAMHRARQLISPMALNCDLILSAEQWQVQWILERAPVLRGRLYRLGHWRNKDIEDPFREDVTVFDSAFVEIDGCVDDWVSRI